MARADRFERLQSRRVPLEKLAEKRFESFSAAVAGKEFSYLVDSMQPIDAEFTRNTFAEADRVKEQLKNNLHSSYLVEFDYQGSVTSDTHIRIHSDIDLLAMNGRFISLDLGTPNTSPYSGNVLVELQAMRDESAKIIKEKFPAATVSDKLGKAIAIEGGSLRRKIDLIIGNWWDTELWKQYKVKMARGIQIIDTKVPTLIRNKPFWHNYEIEKKDKTTGGLRKAIRLLKTLKYDADPELKLSSYDIAALAWNMTESALTVRPDAYLSLATNIRDELKRFIDNSQVRESLPVPNGTRLIFAPGGATLEGLRQLYRELAELIERVNAETIINLSKAGSFGSTRKLPTWQESRPEVVARNSF